MVSTVTPASSAAVVVVTLSVMASSLTLTRILAPPRRICLGGARQNWATAPPPSPPDTPSPRSPALCTRAPSPAATPGHATQRAADPTAPTPRGRADPASTTAGDSDPCPRGPL